jgi:hypothetical protein
MTSRVLAVCCAVGLAFLAGCGIFETRDPETPNQGTSGYRPADVPTDVLFNFQLAIQNHDADNYIRCLSDTASSGRPFVFTPSAGNFQDIFRSWSLDDERRYFQNLGTPTGGTPFISFADSQWVNSTSSTTEFTSQYVFFYPHLRADLPRSVAGFMHLYLALDSQRRWSVYRWDDVRTTSDSTWSYLKAHF